MELEDFFIIYFTAWIILGCIISAIVEKKKEKHKDD